MTDLGDLSVASYTILAGLMGVYIYVYTLYRRRYFLWLGLAWGLNAAYIRTEAWIARAHPDFTELVALTAISGIGTVFFYFAVADLLVLSKKRQLFLGLSLAATLLAAIVFFNYTPTQFEPWRKELLLGLAALLTAIPLIRCAATFVRTSPHSLLLILRDPTAQPYVAATSLINDPTLTDPDVAAFTNRTSPIVTPEIQRHLRAARALLVSTFSIYGLLQFAYPFRDSLTKTAPIFFVALFWIALGTKALHGLALPFWILGDFKSTAEVLRTRSVAEELGVLAASIEHDIKNPVGVLRKELDSARRHYQSDGPLVERFARINRQIDRIQAAADIIPTTREIAEKYRALSEDLNIVSVVEAAATSVRKLDRTGRLRMDVGAVRSDIRVHGDRARLTQAFVNLINNGIEAALARDDNSSLLINIRTTLDIARGRVVIKIRDNGIGIPAVLRDKITRPFFTTKATLGKNRGIGLFIATRVIRMHNGEFQFESDGATYTEVTVALPAVAHATQRRTSS